MKARPIKTIQNSWFGEEKADTTLDLVDAADLAGANLRIHQTRMEPTPTRKRLVKTGAKLCILHADFIRNSEMV
jgi:hypothetical protein